MTDKTYDQCTCTYHEGRNTYQGFTRKDLMKRFDYKPHSGEFLNRKTGQVITTTKGGRLVIGIRVGNSVLTLSPAKLAYMIMDDRVVAKGEMVKFLDGDSSNLKYDNLSIITKVKNIDKPNAIDYWTTPTEKDGVVLLHPSMVFVVRRGPTQAVYRTFDYDLAVRVREEWEKYPSIHRWDYTMPDHYLPKGALR
ncbi:hypothetical protein UFOVP59_60 [uncultured Caudovirales phage]|uniref:Uncharacterized protein n=1 Tax=uncultured Caudovirales phage TaxID=2100421 RepID=A0A6J5KXI5_9CAUD|nr:hypothetical protein UFOVP59_60 [uncultured Caudovirales phage]CAB5220909.1 hypothetical protein UFOVP246_55 [uncultured Caudovirales phage]